MKRTLICTTLAFGMATLPIISEARDDSRGHGNGRGGYSHDNGRGYNNDHRGRGNDYRRGQHYNNHNHYYNGGRVSSRVDVWPYVLGAVALGAVASIASEPAYYGGTSYYSAPQPTTRVYYSAPSYGYVVPQRTCTYYPDGSSYCN